jgi:hypothetical protein
MTLHHFRAVPRESLAAAADFLGSLNMKRLWMVAIGLTLGLNLLAVDAGAQWFYPGGYGNYGMSRWGQDPASGYMAGLGSFARGAGEYQLEKAKADAINEETMVKWNKALRARQKALREEQEKEAAKREGEREARVARLDLRDGTTLNKLLFEIYDFDPATVKSARAKTPLSASVIREIPLEWDSEAISTCIDQMTGKDSLPLPLMDAKYLAERNALRAAVEPALEEDAKGTVSAASRKRIKEAVANFRAKFLKNSSDFQVGYQDALDYFTTLASLIPLLNDPSMKEFIAKVEDNESTTIGRAIAFMNSHNLRFGPATSDRQIAIYRELVPILTAVRDDVRTQIAASTDRDRTGEGLKSAAKQAFKSMSWDSLEAHGRNQ